MKFGFYSRFLVTHMASIFAVSELYQDPGIEPFNRGRLQKHVDRQQCDCFTIESYGICHLGLHEFLYICCGFVGLCLDSVYVSTQVRYEMVQYSTVARASPNRHTGDRRHTCYLRRLNGKACETQA